MMSRNTSMTNASTENLDERIGAIEAEIDELNRRWKPYAKMQPMRPGWQTGMGAYDPARFLEKSEISMAIDRKEIELARLERQRAQQELDTYVESGALSRAQAAYQNAERALEEANRALQVAQMEYSGAWDGVRDEQERHARLARTVAQYEHDEQRWAKELQRDQQLQEYAGGSSTARPSKVA